MTGHGTNAELSSILDEDATDVAPPQDGGDEQVPSEEALYGEFQTLYF